MNSWLHRRPHRFRSALHTGAIQVTRVKTRRPTSTGDDWKRRTEVLVDESLLVDLQLVQPRRLDPIHSHEWIDGGVGGVGGLEVGEEWARWIGDAVIRRWSCSWWFVVTEEHRLVTFWARMPPVQNTCSSHRSSLSAGLGG